MRNVLRRWIVGFLIATAMTWAVGAICSTEVSNRQWDPEVGDYVVHGTRRLTSEGAGSVYFNDDGILGAASGLDARDEHVVLWGDSFIESLNVGDADSVYSQLTALAEEQGLKWRAVAVAQSGRDIVDHLRLLPAHRSKIPNIKAHVVVVRADDVLPPASMDALAPVARQKNPTAPGALALRPIIQKYRLQAFWTILDRYRDAASTLRFRPGPTPMPDPAGAAGLAKQPAGRRDREMFWRQWATEFKTQAGNAQVVVVYHPATPTLEHGKIVRDDPDKELMDDFATVCRGQGIEFLSLSDVFCDFTRRTGRFPCGFANSYPSRGHWNCDGHRLAAEAIRECLCASGQPEHETSQCFSRSSSSSSSWSR